MVFAVVLDDRQNELAKEIFEIVSKKISCVYFGETQIEQSGDNPKITIVQNSDLSKINLKRYILFLGREGLAPICDVSGAHTVVLKSDEPLLAKTLKTFCGQILTCGMGDRDTVTINSNINKNKIVGLNRRIKTLRNQVLEETEIGFDSNNYSDFAVMCAATLLFMI